MNESLTTVVPSRRCEQGNDSQPLHEKPIKEQALSPIAYRWCPRPIPSVNAFCLNEPSDRFINFVSFDTGVLAFECVFNSLMSAAVYSLRTIFFFVDFLATSISNLIQGGLISW